MLLMLYPYGVFCLILPFPGSKSLLQHNAISEQWEPPQLKSHIDDQRMTHLYEVASTSWISAIFDELRAKPRSIVPSKGRQLPNPKAHFFLRLPDHSNRQVQRLESTSLDAKPSSWIASWRSDRNLLVLCTPIGHESVVIIAPCVEPSSFPMCVSLHMKSAE